MRLRIRHQGYKAMLVLAAGLMSALAFIPAGVAEGKHTDEFVDGADFRQAALEFEAEAKKFQKKGYAQVAALYARLAEIKHDAAELADEGRWDEIDWTEYKALNKDLEGLLEKK